MNILVTGSNGQLGKCFHDYADFLDPEEYTIFFTDHESLDITDYEALKTFIEDNEIDMVLNFAAYTNVPGAEEHIESAYKVNTLGPGYLASLMAKRKGVMLHISTDYVYSPFVSWEVTPFTEKETHVFPQNQYGITKRFGEIAVMNSGCRYFIIRTSWLYSTYGVNFMKKVCEMLEDAKEGDLLKFVSDQIGTPTSAHSLAWFIKDWVLSKRYEDVPKEVVNYSQAGVCSWYDFACAIRTMLTDLTGKVYPEIVPCNTSDFQSNVKRPYYSVMSKDQLYKRFPDDKSSKINWMDTLKDVLIEYIEKCGLK